MATNDLSLKIPALATKMWTPPKASKAALTRASPSSAEHTAAVALPPADGLLSAATAYTEVQAHGPLRISSTTALAFFSLTSFTTTLAPSRASSNAYDLPRPAPEPVTIAVFPSYLTSGEVCLFGGVFLAASSLPCEWTRRQTAVWANDSWCGLPEYPSLPYHEGYGKVSHRYRWEL